MPVKQSDINASKDSFVVDSVGVYNIETQPIPKPEREIGIDTNSTVFQDIIDAGVSSTVDMSSLDSFTRISHSRDSVFSLLDSMCEDSTISAVLETYVEDATESNEEGLIVWCESTNDKAQKYVTFLLDAMNIDKHVHKWATCLCKYGDVYLRMYRQSDFEGEDGLFSKNPNKKLNQSKRRKPLNEDVRLKLYKQDDHFVNYLEMHPNPAEMYELTKFGKTYAYVKAPVNTAKSMNSADTMGLFGAGQLMYKFKKNDVDVYQATSYVHGSLEDNSSRVPEEVQIINSNDDNDALKYTVRRGQSLLYDAFKVWRELTLLENSVLLNRLTKSSIIRLIQVQIGDMPKENIGPHLQGVKSLIEQKSALAVGQSLSEYTNPGPIENNIYVPIRSDGQGTITTSQIGGDVDVKSLADLSYYQDKLFGALKVPKQFFGIVDDAAGFSGGSSLSIISSRYAKTVKRIQATLCQIITDAVNLLLLDKGLTQYVNEFTIKMQAPATQEDIDRQNNLSSKVQLVSDVMNMLGDVEDTQTKLKILKSMLSTVISNQEVISILQDTIDSMEPEEEEPEETTDTTDVEEMEDLDTFSDFDSSPTTSDFSSGGDLSLGDELFGDSDSEETVSVSDAIDSVGTTLPTPEELGVDMTQFQ